MRYWLKDLDEIDRECVHRYEYLLGRKLNGYSEYHEIDGKVDEMILEWESRKDFFKAYPEVVGYRERKNENVCICVYRDTIERHNEDWNLTEILVSMDFARQYFDECLFKDYDEDVDADNWIMNHTADDTADFFQYANERRAIIEMEHLK